MKTPTIDEMKLAVARMLPGELEVYADKHVVWTAGGSGRPFDLVLETEWLHVCWLMEETLTEDEACEYDAWLDRIGRWARGIDDFCFHTSFNARLLGICRVRCPEMFEP